MADAPVETDEPLGKASARPGRQFSAHAGGGKRKLTYRPGRRVFTTPGGKKLVVAIGRDKKGVARWHWNVRKALDALDAAIAKAGLIRPGKPPLVKRVGFLLRAGSNDRLYRAGRYLASRKRGARLGRSVKRRSGIYTGVYKMGASGAAAIDVLFDAIEKAKGGMIRGGSKRMARVATRRGAISLAERIGAQRKKGGRLIALYRGEGASPHNPFAVGRRTGRYK